MPHFSDGAYEDILYPSTSTDGRIVSTENSLFDFIKGFFVLDMNALREIVVLTQTYRSLIENTANYTDLPFGISQIEHVSTKSRKKLLKETILTAVIAICALFSILLNLLALLVGKSAKRNSQPQIGSRRYSIVVSLLCSNFLIASRFFGIPVTIWSVERNNLWHSSNIICVEKLFESLFYVGNISEMLTLCLLAIYHLCYILPNRQCFIRIRYANYHLY